MIVLLACAPPPYAVPPDKEPEDNDNERFELGEVQSCPDPVALGYDELGGEYGFEGAVTAGVEHLDGGSMAIADLDGDGYADLVHGFLGEPLYLHRGDGEGFHEQAQILHDAGETLYLGDVDLDGDIDLLGAGSFLWIGWNEGGTFTREDIDLGDTSALARELALVDLEGDGVPEIFAAVTSPDPSSRTDRLGRFDGSTWVFETLEPDLAQRSAFDVHVLDQDGDGDLDVYVVNDHGLQPGPNVLWENRDGTLVDGSEACDCDIGIAAMGVSEADYDADGQRDLYVAASGSSVLLRGQGAGFVDVTAATGADSVEDHSMAWGSAWLDHDNDGDVDLLVAEGDLWTEEDGLPHYEAAVDLLSWTTSGFEDVGPGLGLPETGSHRVVLAEDFNGDGVLDILASDIEQRLLFYLSRGCTEQGWVEIDVPRHARVEIHAGGVVQTRWMDGDPGYQASHLRPLHFGLGGSSAIDRVVVTLLSGEELLLEGPVDGRRLVALR